ncbi:MAG: DNA translocase FtsK, partial [Myxococcota bacterium]
EEAPTLPPVQEPSLTIAPITSSGVVEVTPGELISGGTNDDGRAVVVSEIKTPFELPHLNLLDSHARDVANFDELELQTLAKTLEEKLQDFGVKGEVVAIRPGPVITTFEYLPAAGIKVSKIAGLSDDIAMALKALRVRIIAPIPGKGVVGIEIPNEHRQTVWIRDMLASSAFREHGGALPMALGKTVDGKPRVADLSKMPHLLVGGTTGSGKSVGVNAMLLSLLYTRTPEELRMILVDPKMLEFEMYRDIPHLLHPVVTDPKLASAALKWACVEMDNRYRTLSQWKVRSIANYNAKLEKELEDWTPAKARQYAPPDWPENEVPPPPKRMPYLVIVIDELADLMMVAAKDVEESIIRIAQKARAAGIHLIVATQRPSVNVITGLIKANMPSRIAFQVRTKIDGRTILDQNGAEALLGKGDMLFLPPGVSALERVHGPFVSDDEVNGVTDFTREQAQPVYEASISASDGTAKSIDEDEYDVLYDEAVAFIVSQGKASSSMIQRQFKIGYNRAARMIEVMEQEEVVGPADGSRPRQVLVGQTG